MGLRQKPKNFRFWIHSKLIRVSENGKKWENQSIMLLIILTIIESVCTKHDANPRTLYKGTSASKS